MDCIGYPKILDTGQDICYNVMHKLLITSINRNEQTWSTIILATITTTRLISIVSKSVELVVVVFVVVLFVQKH